VQLSRLLIIHRFTRAEPFHEVINSIYHRSISFWFEFWRRLSVFGQVVHFFRTRIKVRGTDLLRRFRGRIGNYRQVLVGKFARHLRQQSAHQVPDPVHFHAAIEDNSQLVSVVEEGPINDSLLRVSVTNTIEERDLPLLKLLPGVGLISAVLLRLRRGYRGFRSR
jgi:hypothetical protein